MEGLTHLTHTRIYCKLLCNTKCSHKTSINHYIAEHLSFNNTRARTTHMYYTRSAQVEKEKTLRKDCQKTINYCKKIRNLFRN